jgi:putative salt-induced outer membrane protein YdiY
MSILLPLAASLVASTPVAAQPTYGAPLPSPRLAAIAQDAAVEPDPAWTGFVTVGATLTSGNTEIQSAAANAEAVLDRGEDRWTLRAYWNFSQQENQTTGENEITQRQAGASAKYDYFLSERTYLYGTGAVSTDEIAALDMRYQVGAGAGHQFWKEEKRSLSGEVGLSYVDEDFEVDADDDSFVAVRLAYDLFLQLSDTTAFRQIAEAFPSLENKDDIYGRLDSSLTVNLTKSMIGKLQHVMDYDNTPATGADRLDHRLILTIGWTF